MMSEVVGVRWVRIEVERKGRKRIIRIDGVLDIDAEAIVGASENENATLVNPPFWKGAFEGMHRNFLTHSETSL